jgi:hypothetical protein
MPHSIIIDLDAKAPSGPTLAEAVARNMPLNLMREFEPSADVLEAARRSRRSLL